MFSNSWLELLPHATSVPSVRIAAACSQPTETSMNVPVGTGAAAKFPQATSVPFGRMATPP
jgi:hypothetical protein